MLIRDRLIVPGLAEGYPGRRVFCRRTNYLRLFYENDMQFAGLLQSPRPAPKAVSIAINTGVFTEGTFGLLKGLSTAYNITAATLDPTHTWQSSCLGRVR